jgi:hypothetical protein
MKPLQRQVPERSTKNRYAFTISDSPFTIMYGEWIHHTLLRIHSPLVLILYLMKLTHPTRCSIYQAYMCAPKCTNLCLRPPRPLEPQSHPLEPQNHPYRPQIHPLGPQFHALGPQFNPFEPQIHPFGPQIHLSDS